MIDQSWSSSKIVREAKALIQPISDTVKRFPENLDNEQETTRLSLNEIAIIKSMLKGHSKIRQPLSLIAAGNSTSADLNNDTKTTSDILLMTIGFFTQTIYSKSNHIILNQYDYFHTQKIGIIF